MSTDAQLPAHGSVVLLFPIASHQDHNCLRGPPPYSPLPGGLIQAFGLQKEAICGKRKDIMPCRRKFLSPWSLLLLF